MDHGKHQIHDLVLMVLCKLGEFYKSRSVESGYHCFFFLKFVIQREQRGSRRAMEGLSAIGYLGSYSGLGGPHWLLTAFN